MKTLLLFQIIYYALTGIWPLIHIKSFMRVTGPKKDIWLVKTVGLLVIVFALVMVSGFQNPSPPILMCAIASSLAFICIDTYYVFKGVISAIYLADAVIQMFFVVTWLIIVL